MQLKERFLGQQLVTSTFNILFPHRLARASNDEISKETSNLLSLYSQDFTEGLESELRASTNEFHEEIKGKRATVDLVDLMLESHVSSSFPQVYKALFLYTTIPVTVATAERSFSKLKLIKIYLRSTMAQGRLLDVSILSLENEDARSIDKRKLIVIFARMNARSYKNIL